jgi:hypothetical protein
MVDRRPGGFRISYFGVMSQYLVLRGSRQRIWRVHVERGDVVECVQRYISNEIGLVPIGDLLHGPGGRWDIHLERIYVGATR